MVRIISFEPVILLDRNSIIEDIIPMDDVEYSRTASKVLCGLFNCSTGNSMRKASPPLCPGGIMVSAAVPSGHLTRILSPAFTSFGTTTRNCTGIFFKEYIGKEMEVGGGRGGCCQEKVDIVKLRERQINQSLVGYSHRYGS